MPTITECQVQDLLKGIRKDEGVNEAMFRQKDNVKLIRIEKSLTTLIDMYKGKLGENNE